MSVDLIAGVLNAVDSSTRRSAELKLKSADASKDVATSMFDRISGALTQKPTLNLKKQDLIAEVIAAASPGKLKDAELSLAGLTSTETPESAKAMQSFEKVLLTQVVDQMLPDADETSLYGSGTAADVWRGFQTENLATALSENGLLNLRTKDAAEKINGAANWPFVAVDRITPFAA